MKKSTSIQLILATAAASGAAYFLFFTKRGVRMRKQLMKEAANALDGVLEHLENQLADAEARAREEMTAVKEEVESTLN